MSKTTYLAKVNGLPEKKRKGSNTVKGQLPKQHVYEVKIYNSSYFKVQFHRGNLNVCKYFHNKLDAEIFVSSLSVGKEFTWKKLTKNGIC